MKNLWLSLSRSNSSSSKSSKSSKHKKDNGSTSSFSTVLTTSTSQEQTEEHAVVETKTLATTEIETENTEENSIPEKLDETIPNEQEETFIAESEELETNSSTATVSSTATPQEQDQHDTTEYLSNSPPAIPIQTQTEVTVSPTSTAIQKSEKKSRYMLFTSLLNNSTHSLVSFAIENKKEKNITSSSEAETNQRFKLFRALSNAPDSEYKAIEKAWGRFQSKERHKVEVLKAVLIPWLKKNTTNSSDKSLQSGRAILIKWWDALLMNLPSAAYTDRVLYFDCILSLMTRAEFEELDRIGPLPHSDDPTYNDIPIEIIVNYRNSLMSTLHYAIDRLNQKGVYSNVISFCARVLALCFFKIPGIGFALLQALPVTKSHIKRVLNETVESFKSSGDWITKQNDKIRPIFPSHMSILCFSNLRIWWKQFENAKKIWGEPPIEMSGNWIRRWQSDDSDLFFSFYKHYHVTLKSYLSRHLVSSSNIGPSPIDYITAPGYLHLAAFFLNKIESLIHRNIHTITTVIQLEHPRPGGNPSQAVQAPGFNANFLNLNASAVNIDMGTFANGMMGPQNGNGKPKVLEIAGKRFVETLVSIVEHRMYEDMCNIWIKALATKTNMYDVEGVFCLLDFLETLIIELDGRDSASSPNDLQPRPGNVTSCSTASTASSTTGLISIVDIPFYLSLMKLLLEKSDHTITLLRTISFIYTHFCLFTSKPLYFIALVKDLLLEEEMFERLFCHWSRNVRIYFMRLLVWRVSRINLGKTLVDNNEKEAVGEENMIEHALFTMKNRIESVRLCYKFLSDYAGDLEDVETIIKEKLAETMSDSLSIPTTSTPTTTTPISTTDEEVSQQTIDSTHNESSPANESRHTSSSSLASTSSDSSSLQRKSLESQTQSSFQREKEIPIKDSMAFRSSSSAAGTSSPQSTISKNDPNLELLENQKPSQELPDIFTYYARHRHIYAGKALQEYEAVSQEYTEWCAQISSTEKRFGGMFVNETGTPNGNGNSGNGSNNNDTSMVVRFPGLMVEYPKYFGLANAGIPI